MYWIAAGLSIGSTALLGAVLIDFKSLFGKKEKKFKCPKCKADVDDTAKVCPKCGAVFEAGGFECPECRSPVSERDKECPNCGNKFEVGENYACPECGAFVKVNAKKCPACGAKFWSPVKPSEVKGAGKAPPKEEKEAE